MGFTCQSVMTFPDSCSQGEQTEAAKQDIVGLSSAKTAGTRMRIFGAVLVFLVITYFWDAEYNNGRFTDAARSMGQSILHSTER